MLFAYVVEMHSFMLSHKIKMISSWKWIFFSKFLPFRFFLCFLLMAFLCVEIILNAASFDSILHVSILCWAFCAVLKSQDMVGSHYFLLCAEKKTFYCVKCQELLCTLSVNVFQVYEVSELWASISNLWFGHSLLPMQCRDTPSLFTALYRENELNWIFYCIAFFSPYRF